MRHAWKMLGWILAGALASSAGLGIFLFQANRDRAELVRLLQAAEVRVKDAETNQRTTASEADQKIRQASEEVKRAEALLAALKEERDALTRAVTLTRSRAVASWKETVSLPLGVSLRTPSGFDVVVGQVSDGQPRLAVYATSPTTSTSTESRAWLVITPYTEASQAIEQSTTKGEDRAYLVAGKLLIGKAGTMSSGEAGVILRAQAVASSTHLIVANVSQPGSEKRLLEVLSTLTFAP